MDSPRPRTAHEDRPSPWAVALFVAATGFALVAIALLSTGYGLA